jgi:hypothetical protein
MLQSVHVPSGKHNHLRTWEMARRQRWHDGIHRPRKVRPVSRPKLAPDQVEHVFAKREMGDFEGIQQIAWSGNYAGIFQLAPYGVGTEARDGDDTPAAASRVRRSMGEFRERRPHFSARAQNQDIPFQPCHQSYIGLGGFGKHSFQLCD